MSKYRYTYEFGLINTIRPNFNYLPFRKAIRLPILASRHLRIRELNGSIFIKKYHLER